MTQHGYYWVKRKHSSNIEIAMLTKNSGWRYFDGSHAKMIPHSPAEILSKADEIHTALVTTEAEDNYLWAFKSKPSIDEILSFLIATENATEEDREYYRDTTQITITQLAVH